MRSGGLPLGEQDDIRVGARRDDLFVLQLAWVIRILSSPIGSTVGHCAAWRAQSALVWLMIALNSMSLTAPPIAQHALPMAQAAAFAVSRLS